MSSSQKGDLPDFDFGEFARTIESDRSKIRRAIVAILRRRPEGRKLTVGGVLSYDIPNEVEKMLRDVSDAELHAAIEEVKAIFG